MINNIKNAKRKITHTQPSALNSITDKKSVARKIEVYIGSEKYRKIFKKVKHKIAQIKYLKPFYVGQMKKAIKSRKGIE